jgi:predicted phosphodiesterase
MLFLCVSDIHGHLDALAAVLATAERRNFQKLLVAGDIVFPGPEPLETWKRLSASGAVLVQGLSDKAIATLEPSALPASTSHERNMVERMRATRSELGDIILGRLRRLPTHQRFPLEDGGELVLVHGAPADPGEALTHDMTDDELNALLGDDPADVVVCGMSHVHFDRTVGDVRFINVGSVGEAPDGTTATRAPGANVASDSLQRRSSIAHATWIESTPTGLIVEQISVPLDATYVPRALSR